MFEIHLINTPRELTQLTQLRYAVYVEELGATMEHADHERREIRDAWDATAIHLGVWRDGELMGGVRLNCAPETDLTAYAAHCRFAEWQRLEAVAPLRFSVASKFVVHKIRRGGTLTLQLSRASYEQLLLHHASLNFITCQASLKRFYQKFGYRICGAPFSDGEAGSLTPMVLVVEDQEYLEQIQSPFLAVCRRFDVNQAHATALRKPVESWQAKSFRCATLSPPLWEPTV